MPGAFDGEDPRDVVEAGEQLLDAHPRVDLLVHSDRPTGDGTDPPIDDRPACTVDATATLALTAILRPGLARALGGRIVTVTPRSDLQRPPTGPTHEPFRDQPRLDLLDFTTVLHQRLTAGGSRVASVAADPGEATRRSARGAGPVEGGRGAMWSQGPGRGSGRRRCRRWHPREQVRHTEPPAWLGGLTGPPTTRGTRMHVFDHLDGHELVVVANDDATGLRAIVALHSTALGPALGGTRMRPYATEDDALADVLALSQAMTLKNAAAGLDHGGGKAVIIADPATDKTPELFAAYGRALDALGGRYVTACDVGTTPQDMVAIRTATPWATGRPREAGGAGDSGVLTAHGVEVAMHAAAAHRWGSPDLAGRHIVVQGLGKVGRRLATSLLDQGARVTVTDVDEAAVAALVERGAEAVAPTDVLDVRADVLSPNALGGVLDQASIPGLDVAVVCGGANNQLVDPVRDAQALRDEGILYAPDYIVNAGGVIAVSGELHPDGYDDVRARAAADRIGATLQDVFATADANDTSTEEAARALAGRRIDAARASQAKARETKQR